MSVRPCPPCRHRHARLSPSPCHAAIDHSLYYRAMYEAHVEFRSSRPPYQRPGPPGLRPTATTGKKKIDKIKFDHVIIVVITDVRCTMYRMPTECQPICHAGMPCHYRPNIDRRYRLTDRLIILTCHARVYARHDVMARWRECMYDARGQKGSSI